MRTSVLTRSVISVASFAIGSMALAASPATAAPSGVTRELVLTVAQDARDFTSGAAVRQLIASACSVTDEVGLDYSVRPAQQSSTADGVLVEALIGGGTSDSRFCTFAAFAATDPFTTLSGTATLTGYRYLTEGRAPDPATIQTSTLKDDVFVTTPVDTNDYYDVVATADGNTVRTTSTTSVSDRVVTPKSTRQKRAARTVYDRRIASATKKYTKAVAKAGSSSSKKKAAKKTYRAARATAKKSYLKATAGTVRADVTTTSKTVSTPFTLTTESLGCKGISARC